MTDLALIPAFVTLFVVIDPIGLTPLFMAMTQGASSAERRAIALRAVAVAFVLLTLFGLMGEAVLGVFGITMPAFRIAGGLLLFLTALDMLFERRTKRREDQSSEAQQELPDDPSVFPLATPLIGGPGAMAAMILLVGSADGPIETIAMLAVMALVLLVVTVLFLSASLLERALGRTGINVLTRLLGMLLAALAVQFVIDGLLDVGLLGSGR